MTLTPYNLSMVANNTGIVSMIQQTNDILMFGYFGYMLLIVIGLVTFMAFMHRIDDAGKSVAASSYIVFISCIFLRGMDLVPDFAIAITLIILAISTAMLFFTK